MQRLTSVDFSPAISTWASSLVVTAGFSSPPVDLFRVAKLRHIRSISIRPMVPRGGLVPIEQGFAMYVRGDRHFDIDSPVSEPPTLLSHRQRFAVAHEIAHTFFYDLARDEPTPRAATPKARMLEDLCDQAAGLLLVPTEPLRRQSQGGEDVDIEFVRRTASAFNVSLAVALRALAGIAALSPAARCIVLVRRQKRDDALITALCFGTGLLRSLRRPVPFTPLGQWLPALPSEVIARRQDHEWVAGNAGRVVRFRKVEFGSSTFLLQADGAADD